MRKKDRCGSMNFRTHGPSPVTAVVVHGGPGAPGSAYSLARGLSVLMGTLEPFQTAMSIELQIEELAEQIRAHADPPVFLFGHSWGAWLSLLTSQRYPALVRKLFLIGAGPLTEKYVPEINVRRRARLSDSERVEYDRLPGLMAEATGFRKQDLLSRLGELAGKADAVALEDAPEHKESAIPANANQFQQIWSEASAMRADGTLLRISSQLQVPVRVIHGVDDSHPISGVIEPLGGVVKDLHWYGLDRCGHEPWKETYARDAFWKAVHWELQSEEAESTG
jgi:pimeloyl-ACP methyl ester carboxylesterase